MPGYTDVCVWIQSDKHEALKKALAERNLKLEDQLQEKLEEIYSEYVPQMQREDIAAKIEAEIPAGAGRSRPACCRAVS